MCVEVFGLYTFMVEPASLEAELQNCLRLEDAPALL